MSAWLDQMFNAGAVDAGRIVRRSLADIDHYASFEELVEEVKRRDFHLILTADQAVVFCHDGELKLIC